MNTLFVILLVGLGLLLQASPALQIFTILGWVQPDFVLLTVVYACVRDDNPSVSESLGFWSGLAVDSFSGGLLGVNAFGLTLLAFVVNSVRRGLALSRFAELALFILLSGLSYEAATLLLQKVFSGSGGYFGDLLLVGLPSCLYNAALAPPLFYLADKGRQAALRLRPKD